VARLRLADRAAAEELFNASYPRLAGWVRRLVDDDETAHEIASEAFTRLLARWSGLESPHSYLYMIATNLVRDHWRKTGRERKAIATMTAGAPRDPSYHPAQDVDVRTLIEGLPARSFGSTMFLACGEANIISTQRGSTATVDDFGFMAQLPGRSLILNPSHTYMVRHEMKEKRRRYSEAGRVVLSVWNPGYQLHEPDVPWQAFADGREITERISRIAFAQRSIQVGVFDLLR